MSEWLVVSCPRCREYHEAVEVTLLTRPIVFPGAAFTHWAACPNTGEPILALDKRYPPTGMLLDDYPFEAYPVEASS